MLFKETTIPIYQSSRGTESFYVPAFTVKIEGSRLTKDVVHDVMEVTYNDAVNNMDSFALTLSNWDADRQTYKYIGKGAQKEYMYLFDPGQELEVYMGYQQPLASGSNQSQLTFMMVGQITTIEPNFPSSGNPTLTVRGLNILDRFKEQHTYVWENKRDSEIARELSQKPLSDPALGDRPGLGIPVHIDERALAAEPVEPVVFMHNQYDILFLLERAQRHGYTVYLDEEEKGGRTNRFLYFGPSDNDSFAPYKLEWGKSLIQFRPTLTTAKLVTSVTVRGWDRHTQKPIKATAKWGDPGVRVNLDQKTHLRNLDLDGREEVVVDKPIYTEQQARALAKDLLLNHLKGLVRAGGSTVGLPELRAGRFVQIEGLGQRFDGKYLLTDTSHTIGDSGYQTTFNARREEDGL